MAINYPYRVFRYKVTIDGGWNRAAFSEVTGMNLSVQAVEYREGNDLRNTARKIPGLTSFGNVTFRWGVTDDAGFLDWIKGVAPDNSTGPKGLVRHNITITLLDDKTGADGTSWTLINAWPVSFSAPDLSGLGNEVAIASLEVCCEGIWQTKSVAAGPAGSPI